MRIKHILYVSIFTLLSIIVPLTSVSVHANDTVFDFSKKDLNGFFFRLCEQNDSVASWSDGTICKIKQVLTKSLVECGYLDSIHAAQLNPVSIVPELEDEIRANNDISALAAFNCFR